jgi:putative oxidoreductase
MKKLFSISISDRSAHYCLLLVRIAVSAFMLTHGVPKLNRLFSGGEIQFADPFGFGPAFTLGLAVFAEVICSILIIMGLGTRLAALPLIATMCIAAFHAHAADPFGTKEKPLLFLLIYIFLFVFGSGKYSVDKLISKQV